jgi:hypothetical protein
MNSGSSPEKFRHNHTKFTEVCNQEAKRNEAARNGILLTKKIKSNI